MNATALLVSLVLCTLAPAFSAEYLPVCEKCLNPRITSKSGAGSPSAIAEAKVVPEDAAAWCAVNRPRDSYCAKMEVQNGGDGGRTSYKGSANCNAGVLQSIDGYEYRYAGVWPDGPGLGRPMLKDPTGNIPRWNSIVSGTGKARAEWHRFGGYSLTGQWEVLCGATVPPVASPAKRVAPTKTSSTNNAEWLASCFRCPAPTVTAKAGIGTASATAEGRITAAELRTSCSETDPQSVDACVRREMAELGNKIYRAQADCTTGHITTIEGQQYTLAGIWDNSDLGGGRTKWRGQDGQIVSRDNATNGLAISQQWETLCPGPVNPSLISRAAASPARPAPQAQQAPRTVPSVCSGKRYCEESNSFAAIIRDFRPSSLPDSTRIVSATIKFLNKTNRPLTLGYLRTAAVAIDERGNRYTLPTPENVRGIGEISGREFDPKFTIAAGQTADARFEFIWRWNGRDLLGQKAWDIELAVREAIEDAPRQFRFGAEHVLQFRGVPPAQSNLSEAAPQPVPQLTPQPTTPAEPVQQRPDACAGKRGCFDAGTFVGEIQHTTLTREGNFQDRIVRLTLLLRNTSQQPLSLAYVTKSSVLTDNMGNRFFWGNAGTHDMSAAGIGKVESNVADPQFTIAPGESRSATFTLRRRAARTDPDGTGYTYSVTLAELQVINAQQIRTAREHSLTFPDFALSASNPGAIQAAQPSAAPARPAQQSLKDLSNAIRGLSTKKR